MKSLCIKYFQHINRIIAIVQPNIALKSKHSKFQIRIENRQQMPNENILEYELSTLKQNIQNLLQYCHGLQNCVKISKNPFPSTSEILEQNHYEIRSEDFAEGFFVPLATQSDLQKQKKIVLLMQRENTELKKTRQLYLGSLNKIHQLKTKISDLNLKLNHFAQVYETPDLTETTIESQNDFTANESSMSVNFDRNRRSQPDEIDIETLLCHEDLDMDSSLLKENSSLRANRQKKMLDSLISKGIEHRNQRSMRSNEFRKLSTIVERYREESLSNSKPVQMKKYNSTSYR